MNIKLKCKLSAYTKGILPIKVSELENDKEYISEAPINGVTWARKNGEWVNASELFHGDDIVLEENSGLESTRIDADTITLKLRQWIGKESDLPQTLEEDITYYAVENVPDTFLTGGTAFSDENEESYVVVSGGGQDGVGGASITHFDNEIKPLNAWGVYNE